MRLASTSFSYRAAGDFSQAGRPVEGPLRKLRLPADLVIMKRQVIVAEHARCVDAAACPRIAIPAGAQDAPVVGVGWHDAAAYAAWLSRKTGITHRLPTDEEWTFAAAEKARDEAMPLVDPTDPAQAWIARYEAQSARSRPAATAAQPGGTFGTNSNGWTIWPAMFGSGRTAASCAFRSTAEASGSPTPTAASASWREPIAPT
jgi:formylglycine-generating enzyme required for sulfatase activity